MSDIAPARQTKHLETKLRSITLLYDLSARLLACTTLDETMAAILDAANALHASHLGRIQLYDEQRQALRTVAQRGFDPGLFQAEREVRPGDTFASARAMQTGRPIVIEDVERDLRYVPYRQTALRGGYRSLLAAPLISTGGRFIGVLSTYFRMRHKPSRRSIRVTELYARQAADIVLRVRAEDELRETREMLRLLNRELTHRVKNILGVVQSVALQSRRQARDLDHFLETFGGRLQAIARAQSLLTDEPASAVRLGELIRQQTLADASSQISASGPEIVLAWQPAINLGLVLHELSTNARKYGALSVPDGQVEIRWDVEEGEGERVLHLEWQESGGPPVSPPATKGFGTTLIERVAQSSTGDQPILRFAPSGLLCNIRLALSSSDSLVIA